MSRQSAFIDARHYRPGNWAEFRGVRLGSDFAPPAVEYAAAHFGVVLFDRSWRGRLVVTGTERQGWLHNLVTNDVQNLEEDEGRYAFALSPKGRILFDMNVINAGSELWLDTDAIAVPALHAHLDRYLFTEDVQLQNAPERYARLGCAGPAAADLARMMGVEGWDALPELSLRATNLPSVRLLRHDFAGLPGFELLAPSGEAAGLWDKLADAGARPAGLVTFEALRIEARRPRMGADFEVEVLPAETGQAARAVSEAKGCYPGQEIVERMRSRGIVARRLRRVAMEDGSGLRLPASLRLGEQAVGWITSLVPHPAEPRWIGLAYVKASIEWEGGLVAGEPPRAVVAWSPYNESRA